MSVTTGRLWVMNTSTGADYDWVRSSTVLRYAIEVGYTMTLVRGVPPERVLRVMGAEPRGTSDGIDELVERQEESNGERDEWDESFLAGTVTVPGDGGDWTLVVQFDGGIGMRGRFLEALSTGSRAVVHSGNGGKPIHLFGWWEDGRLRTGFETAARRTGTTPDDLLPLMREVGFDPADATATDTLERKALVFALAERLTGVNLTEELLTRAEYRLGHVPEEPAEE